MLRGLQVCCKVCCEICCEIEKFIMKFTNQFVNNAFDWLILLQGPIRDFVYKYEFQYELPNFATNLWNLSGSPCSHRTRFITRRKVLTQNQSNCSPRSIYICIHRWSWSSIMQNWFWKNHIHSSHGAIKFRIH
jgi:hypothetical protein